MTEVAFRPANAADLPAIIALLREDALGAAREIAPPDHYAKAFSTLARQPQTTLVVGEMRGEVVAFYHLTTIDGLSHAGMRRGNIEDVRVAARLRGRGIGRRMIEDAAARARALGCGMVQLVAHSTRQDAHRFYLSAGFTASHVGFKRFLSDPEEQR